MCAVPQKVLDDMEALVKREMQSCEAFQGQRTQYMALSNCFGAVALASSPTLPDSAIALVTRVAECMTSAIAKFSHPQGSPPPRSDFATTRWTDPRCSAVDGRGTPPGSSGLEGFLVGCCTVLSASAQAVAQSGTSAAPSPLRDLPMLSKMDKEEKEAERRR